MNTNPVDMYVEYTNCCQPMHPGFPPLQAAAVKGLVLSWSEYSLATPSLSLVTPAMFSKDPVAEDIKPVTCAVRSLVPPPPTVFGGGRSPCAGRSGRSGAFVHGTSIHWVFGYSALKQPSFGRGVRAIESRQAFCFANSSGDVAAAGLGAARFVENRPEGSAETAKDMSPDRRLPIAMMPRTLETSPRAVL
jgi:hypothetical protein